MTRRDFNAFAAAFASLAWGPTDETSEYAKGYETARVECAKAIAAICRLDNERFDYGRFARAAKIEEAPVK